MIIEKDGEYYHDEHDCSVKITNDNTKHLKVVSITLRVDLTRGKSLNEVVDTVNEAFERANRPSPKCEESTSMGIGGSN